MPRIDTRRYERHPKAYLTAGMFACEDAHLACCGRSLELIVLDAYFDNGGKRKAAAAAIGIGERELGRWLDRLYIRWPVMMMCEKMGMLSRSADLLPMYLHEDADAARELAENT